MKQKIKKTVRKIDNAVYPLPWANICRPDKKERLLLVGGLPRSGNHLLRGLLDRHPQLLVPPDEDYFSRNLLRSRINQMRGFFCSRADAPKFYRKMQKNGHFEKINRGEGENISNTEEVLNLEKYYRYIINKHKRFVFNALHKIHLEALAEAMGKSSEEGIKTVFCVMLPDKNDILNIGRALNTFYNINAVFIIRDPKAVFASMKRRKYNTDLKSFCKRTNSYYRHIEKFRKKRYGKVFAVAFSDLVENTAAIMKEISYFIGIQYIDIMVNFTLNGKETMSNSSFGQAKGIDAAVVDKYRQVLSEEEISYIDRNTVTPPGFSK